ncbi:hypothetical protein [Uliginosibacterium sp. TH139]|uniref:hypothetical protein n=1 Tax=Uliginosibacterium sp. TH139 TaxID=2067453 RepID=UPI000C79E65D|nr:hypothetical protein [Uliginosibacterium sp. TH139]PLK46960.1 hypothetical protein C0V76_19265 [Uliginosibacterium sp. TH139]
MIVSAEEFARLRKSDDPSEYGRAANEEAAERVWLEMIENFPDLRQWVAHNKTVPISVLEYLSNDDNSQVRSAVAEKRKLTPVLFEKLACDPDASVRGRVANNKKCSSEALALLVEDKEAFVREPAKKQIEERNRAL